MVCVHRCGRNAAYNTRGLLLKKKEKRRKILKDVPTICLYFLLTRDGTNLNLVYTLLACA